MQKSRVSQAHNSAPGGSVGAGGAKRSANNGEEKDRINQDIIHSFDDRAQYQKTATEASEAARPRRRQQEARKSQEAVGQKNPLHKPKLIIDVQSPNGQGANGRINRPSVKDSNDIILYHMDSNEQYEANMIAGSSANQIIETQDQQQNQYQQPDQNTNNNAMCFASELYSTQQMGPAVRHANMLMESQKASQKGPRATPWDNEAMLIHSKQAANPKSTATERFEDDVPAGRDFEKTQYVEKQAKMAQTQVSRAPGLPKVDQNTEVTHSGKIYSYRSISFTEMTPQSHLPHLKGQSKQSSISPAMAALRGPKEQEIQQRIHSESKGTATLTRQESKRNQYQSPQSNYALREQHLNLAQQLQTPHPKRQGSLLQQSPEPEQPLRQTTEQLLAEQNYAHKKFLGSKVSGIQYSRTRMHVAYSMNENISAVKPAPHPWAVDRSHGQTRHSGAILGPSSGGEELEGRMWAMAGGATQGLGDAYQDPLDDEFVRQMASFQKNYKNFVPDIRKIKNASASKVQKSPQQIALEAMKRRYVDFRGVSIGNNDEAGQRRVAHNQSFNMVDPRHNQSMQVSQNNHSMILSLDDRDQSPKRESCASNSNHQQQTTYITNRDISTTEISENYQLKPSFQKKTTRAANAHGHQHHPSAPANAMVHSSGKHPPSSFSTHHPFLPISNSNSREPSLDSMPLENSEGAPGARGKSKARGVAIGGGARPAGTSKGPGFAISSPKEIVLEVAHTSKTRTGVKSDTQQIKAHGASKVKEIKILKFDQRRQQQKNQQAVANKKKSQELNHPNASTLANQIEENENENESDEYSPLIFNDPALADDDAPGHVGRYFDESPKHATIYYQRNERHVNEKNATSQVNLKLKNKLAPEQDAANDLLPPKDLNNTPSLQYVTTDRQRLSQDYNASDQNILRTSQIDSVQQKSNGPNYLMGQSLIDQTKSNTSHDMDQRVSETTSPYKQLNQESSHILNHIPTNSGSLMEYRRLQEENKAEQILAGFHHDNLSSSVGSQPRYQYPLDKNASHQQSLIVQDMLRMSQVFLDNTIANSGNILSNSNSVTQVVSKQLSPMLTINDDRQAAQHNLLLKSEDHSPTQFTRNKRSKFDKEVDQKVLQKLYQGSGKFVDKHAKVEQMRQKRQQGDYKKTWRREREQSTQESKIASKKQLPNVEKPTKEPVSKSTTSNMRDTASKFKKTGKANDQSAEMASSMDQQFRKSNAMEKQNLNQFESPGNHNDSAASNNDKELTFQLHEKIDDIVKTRQTAINQLVAKEMQILQNYQREQKIKQERAERQRQEYRPDPRQELLIESPLIGKYFLQTRDSFKDLRKRTEAKNQQYQQQDRLTQNKSKQVAAQFEKASPSKQPQIKGEPSPKQDEVITIPHYLQIKNPDNPSQEDRVKMIERMVFMTSETMQEHANYQENKYKVQTQMHKDRMYHSRSRSHKMAQSVLLPQPGRIANFRKKVRGLNETIHVDTTKIDLNENEIRDKVDVLLNRLGYVNKRLKLEQELNRHINEVVDDIKRTRLDKLKKKQEQIRIQQEQELAQIEQEVEDMFNGSREDESEDRDEDEVELDKEEDANELKVPEMQIQEVTQENTIFDYNKVQHLNQKMPAMPQLNIETDPQKDKKVVLPEIAQTPQMSPDTNKMDVTEKRRMKYVNSHVHRPQVKMFLSPVGTSEGFKISPRSPKALPQQRMHNKSVDFKQLKNNKSKGKNSQKSAIHLENQNLLQNLNQKIMSVDTSDLLKAHYNRKRNIIRVKLEDKEMANLKSTIAKQKSVNKDQQDAAGKRDTLERDSTISSQTYGLSSKNKFFTEQSRGGQSKLKSSLNLPGEQSNYNEMTDTQTQLNMNRDRPNLYFSNQQKTPSSFFLDTKSAAHDKDSTSKVESSIYESLENNATWTDLDLLNGADAKNQDIVGTIQEQFKKIIMEMNNKYNIKTIKKKKDAKEQDDLMKYMSEEDMKQLEDEDLDPEVREQIIEKVQQRQRKAQDRQKQDDLDKKMAKMERAGGLSADDIINLMNDNQLIERYTQHLSKIIFQHADPYMRAKYDAYLRSQDVANVKFNFFDRMQKDKQMRDNRQSQREEESQQLQIQEKEVKLAQSKRMSSLSSTQQQKMATQLTTKFNINSMIEEDENEEQVDDPILS